MNNTFNIKRFGSLLRKDFLENGSRYLLQFLAMFGIMTIILTWASSYAYQHAYSYVLDGGETYYSLNGLNRELLTTAIIMFLIFGALMASTLMEPMNNKIKRVAYLINPSSDFEKILSRWLIVTFGYGISFFIALWFADAIRVAICSVSFPDIDIRFLDLSKMIAKPESKFYEYVFSAKYFFGACLGFYFLMQSLFILGSTFWERMSFIKTFSAGIIIVLLFLFLCNWAIQIGYDDNSNQFSNVMDSFGSEKAEDQIFFIITGVFGLFTVANWVLAFLRFRESEIIKRL